ncbi:olfactomedin-like protein 1 isoform X1 [Alligator mississippiensis]|uniref:Olfactomedin-like protein 1 n=1 Tax=Alligator mississippiensis TaxID=8496 RepID=A0A151MBT2_ALLMI|nr:olfactomedin-like protein 1 isoform X1 [Alligator mississippiensis]KYO21988.1 olfactomedin-like protein 1 [Alligator mississippiensis]
MANLQLRFLLVSLFTSIVGEAQYVMQDAALMHYIDRRFQSLENRLEKCNQDIMDYVEEFRDFSKRIISRLEGLNVYKTEFKNEVEHLLTRVERAQRDIDYFASGRDSDACVEVDEDLVEQQQIEEAEERRKIKLVLNASCDNMLTGIKSLKIVKKTGDAHGSWMKDPGKNHPKIYFLNRSKNNVILEFANIRAFMESSNMLATRRVILPTHWQGTGHVIYKGFLFYHRYGSLNEIIKYNIHKRNITDRMLLPGAGQMPAYELFPTTKIDLAIDEQGLWAIHAEPDIGGNLVITKINHHTMAVEYTWDTSCNSKNAEAAFMVCKTLYVVYNTPNGGTSRIECVYNVLDALNTYEVPVLHFPKRYGSHSMMHYNPREKEVFAWGDGSQIIYKLETNQKV